MAIMTMKDNKVEISTNGTTWTDISGYTNKIEWDGGEREIAEASVFGEDVAKIAPGKRSPVEITVTVAYDESTSSPLETLQSAYESSSTLQVRWSPTGGVTGSKRYSAIGYVTTPIVPAGDAEASDVLMVEFTLKAPEITVETVL
jgi:hypothetical protein